MKEGEKSDTAQISSVPVLPKGLLCNLLGEVAEGLQDVVIDHGGCVVVEGFNRFEERDGVCTRHK